MIARILRLVRCFGNWVQRPSAAAPLAPPQRGPFDSWLLTNACGQHQIYLFLKTTAFLGCIPVKGGGAFPTQVRRQTKGHPQGGSSCWSWEKRLKERLEQRTPKARLFYFPFLCCILEMTTGASPHPDRNRLSLLRDAKDFRLILSGHRGHTYNFVSQLKLSITCIVVFSKCSCCSAALLFSK